MLLVVLLIVLLLGVVPAWPQSRNWGYRPSGVLGAVLLVGHRAGIVGTYLKRLESALP